MAEPAQLLSAANLWTPTADQKNMLGMIFETEQGDRYRYCKNGGTALAKAVLIAAEALDAQQVAKIQSSADTSAGDTVFTIEVATGSGIDDGELVDGYILINDGGTAMGDMYIIKSHRWTTTDTFMQVVIADAGGLRNEIEATDDVSIIKNQFHTVNVKPTTLTAPIIGATTTIVPISWYFWAKVRGVTSILTDSDGGPTVVGEPVGHIDTAGAEGTIGLVATAATDTVLGTSLYPSTDDEAGLFNIDIPGM